MTTFQQDIYRAVQRIPKGSVASYGQIAALAGYPSAARAAGNALHKNRDPDTIPCYRVVHSDGRLGQGYAYGGIEAQKKRLERDGIKVVGFRVDMLQYGMRDALPSNDG